MELQVQSQEAWRDRAFQKVQIGGRWGISLQRGPGTGSQGRREGLISLDSGEPYRVLRPEVMGWQSPLEGFCKSFVYGLG